MRNPLPDRISLYDGRTPVDRHALASREDIELYKKAYILGERRLIEEEKRLRKATIAVNQLGFETIQEFLDTDLTVKGLGFETKEDLLGAAEVADYTDFSKKDLK